ncbi:MAG: hypothetical protein ACLQVD_00750 [Capsulimonadaceae bacterium]
MNSENDQPSDSAANAESVVDCAAVWPPTPLGGGQSQADNVSTEPTKDDRLAIIVIDILTVICLPLNLLWFYPLLAHLYPPGPPPIVPVSFFGPATLGVSVLLSILTLLLITNSGTYRKGQTYWLSLISIAASATVPIGMATYAFFVFRTLVSH